MKPVFPQSAVMKVQGMPTPDRVVVIPDSVLIVTGTTACRSLAALGFLFVGLFSDG
jgi:hypothetical protein